MDQHERRHGTETTTALSKSLNPAASINMYSPILLLVLIITLVVLNRDVHAHMYMYTDKDVAHRPQLAR